MKWALVLVLCLAGAAVWVRFAPSDPTRWHRMAEDMQPRDLGNGAVRVVDVEEGALAHLDAIIRDTPRTRVLAGAVTEGMVTYVTRTAVIGFPDYTTFRLRDGQIEIFGRARYGLSDLGVNAARIDGWLDALRQGG